MPSLKWKESYSVGNDLLDAQHKGLFELLNRLDDDFEMGLVLDELQQYVEQHFRDEERLMAENGFPDLVAHRQQHAAFEEWLKVTKHAFRSAESYFLLRDHISTYLKTWLVNHIMVSDKAYKGYLK